VRVNIAVELDDTMRGKLRAGMNRGGLATRKDVRVFVNRLVGDAFDKLPEPRRRRVRPPVEAKPVLPVRDTGPCAHCANPLSEHIGALRACPLSKAVKPGSKFTAA
jgi:hypothetical protein